MFAVVFEVEPAPGRFEEYLGLAAGLKPALEAIDGFVAVERFSSRGTPGRVLSLSIWRDEKALVRWRTLAPHHAAQQKGRSEVFADYRLRVGEISSDTDLPPGKRLDRQRFDLTEAGVAQAVTITELVPGRDGAAASADPAADLPRSAALLERDVYESIYNPGKLLLLASWKETADAEAFAPRPTAAGAPRHRVVRIIRDYGMFDRREAPQYYPAKAGA